MKRGLIDANKFGGQLLVRIDREVTKNPKPLEKKVILFNKKSSGKDAKSEIFEQIAKQMQSKGKNLKN